MSDECASISAELSNEHGAIVRIAWRAWRSGDHVRYDLNSILEDLHHSAYKKSAFETHSFVRKNQELFAVLLKRVGVDNVAGHLVASRMSMVRQAVVDLPGGVPPKEVFSCSSLAVVSLLMWFAIAKRAGLQKARAKSLLQLWLQACVEQRDWPEELEDRMDQVCECCADDADESSMCVHLRVFREDVRRGLVEGVGVPLVEILLAFQRSIAVDCEALRVLFRDFVGYVAELADDGAFADENVVLAGNIPPVRSHGPKRRRYDEDWKRAIANDIVTLKQAKSGSIALRAQGLADPHLAQKWELREALAYQAAGFRLFRGTQQIGISSDAARLGDPPEETVLFCVWSAQADVGMVALPQVLPDFNPAVKNESSTEAEISKRRMDERLYEFLDTKADQAEKTVRVRFDKRYEPNVMHLRGMDHALKGSIGMCLADFRAERVPAPLTANQERYYAPSASLPPEVTDGGEHQRRSCIKDKGSGARFLEVTWGPERKCIFETLDCGSVGFPSKFYLYGPGGVRGGFWGDPCHTRFNRFKECIKQSGLWTIWLEGAIVIGVRKGPWSGAAHMAKMLTMVQRLEETSSAENPLFKLCYDYILEDMHKGDVGQWMHSEAERRRVWDAVLHLPIWERKGAKAKASRWFHWNTEMESLIGNMGALLFIVLSICVDQRWYDKLTDTPLFAEAADLMEEGARDAGQVAAEPSAASSSSSARDPASVAEQVVQEKRHGSKNTLHLTAQILCNRPHVKLFKLVTVCGRPTSKAHNKQVTMCKTQMGSVEWWAEMASCGYEEIVREECKTMTCPGTLLEIGFRPWARPMPEDDAEYLEEMMLARTLFEFSLRLMATEVGEGRMYSENFPHRFGSILAQRPQKVAGFAYMKRVWEALCAAESAALDNHQLKRFLRDLAWPGFVWVREVFITAAENRFESLPKACFTEVQSAGRSFRTSKPSEDLFNCLRDQERAHRANKLGRTSRWHKSFSADVLRDCDRKHLPVTDADRFCAGKKLPPTAFEARACECSLGQPALERFVEAKSKDWASPQPHDWHLVAHGTAALLKSHEQNDFGMLSSAWLALLAEPFTYLHRLGAEGQGSGIVLEPSEYGVVLWKAQPKAAGGCRWWELEPGDGEPIVQVMVSSLQQGWMVIDLEAVPPAVAAARFPNVGELRSKGLVAMPAPPARSWTLVQFAAKRGFRRLSVGYLRQLAAELQVQLPQPRPRTELEWLRLLVSHVLHPIEACEVDRILEEYRGKKVKPNDAWGSVFSAGNVDQADGVLEAEDAKEARQVVHEKEVLKKLALSRASARRAGGRAPRQQQFPQHAEYSREWAKQFLPKVPGCTVNKDSRLHFRWVVSYPRREAPFSKSCVWNEQISQREALLVCLRWAWSEHRALTGEEPKWKLDS